MKKRVEELVRETFLYDTPELLCSADKLCIPLEEGKQFQGSINVRTSDGSKIRGYAFSDSHRMPLANDSFSGNECTITYGIDTVGLSAGDKTEGNITLLTSAGEKIIPVTGIVGEEKTGLSEEQVRNLDDFAKLAARNYREAFRIFKSDKFDRLLKGKNAAFQAVYKGLSKNPVTYQHLEEFLIAAGKKEPVHIYTDKTGKTVYDLNSSIKDTIYIYKNTWGHLRIEAAVFGDFIEIEKKVITTEDFIGKVCALEIVLNKDKMTSEHHTGRIELRTAYDTVDIDIEVFGDREDMRPVSASFRKNRIWKIVKSFLELRMKKLDYRSWYELTSAMVGELEEDGPDNFTVLCRAYLAYCQEEYKEMITILWPFKENPALLTDINQKAAYLYLAKEAGLIPKEKKNIAPKLYAYYQQDPKAILPLALYINEDEESSERPPETLALLEKAYECGCISPFLYLKAWKMLAAQESLLRRLSPFYIRVLMFAQKQGLLTRTMLLRSAFLSTSQKNFSPVFFKILTTGYDSYPEKDLLEAICKYIMKGSPLNKKYFKWYKLALDADIRLTRLYEYYMETRPEDSTDEFPLNVRLYFMYTQSLSDRKKACLYAGIVRDKKNDQAGYDNYADIIRDFALKELLEGNVNEHLAVLYDEFFSQKDDLEIITALSKIMFMYKFKCEDPAIRQVIVCHPALRDEAVYQVTDGTAYINVYGPDDGILLEDDKKRRFSATIKYEMTPLFDSEKLISKCLQLGIWDTGIQLSGGRESGRNFEINSKNVLSFWKAAENPEFTRPYRDRLRKKLLGYFEKREDNLQIEPYINAMKDASYGWIDKKRTVRLLLRFEKYDRAFALIFQMGREGIDIDSLFLIAKECTVLHYEEENEDLLNLDAYLFRQKRYNTKTLGYMLKNFNSSLDEMCGVWDIANNMAMDVSALGGRILLTSMFVRKIPGNGEQILENFINWEGNPAVSRAYLTFIAVSALLDGRPFSDKTAIFMGRVIDEKEKGTTLISLAWLKYISMQDTIFGEDRDRAARILKSCSDDALRFSFMKDLPEEITQGFELEDKCFAEERFESGSSCTVYYRIKSDDGNCTAWKNEPMKEKIKGLYVREFLLFYGETLEYYCTVRKGDSVRQTEVRFRSVKSVETNGRTRYQILNRMLAADASMSFDELNEAARLYRWQDAYTSEFFKIR